MKISLSWMDQIRGEWERARPYVIQQFEDLASQISVGWNQEHNADGTQKQATAMTGNVITTAGFGTFTGQHRAHVKFNADITLTTSVETAVTWNIPAGSIDAPDIGWNKGPLFNTNSPTLLTALVEGLYLINYAIRFEAVNGTGVRYAYLTAKGSTTHLSTLADFGQAYEGGLANGNTVTCSVLIPMSPGENVQLKAFQSSGGNLKILSGFTNSWIQMTKIA